LPLEVGIYYNPDPFTNPPEECPSPAVPLVRVAPRGEVVVCGEEEQGTMAWEDFVRLLMVERRSQETVEQWEAEGKVEGPEAAKFELKEARAKLDKVSEKLKKVGKQQQKQKDLIEKIARLEEADFADMAAHGH